MREQRRKIWIDRFQTHLGMRITLYFILYQVAAWAVVLIERSINRALEQMHGEPATYSLLVLAIPIVLLGILFIYDATKLTHRVVGPLYRFRKTVQAITAGEPLDLVTLRHGDFLQELKEDFNNMLKALEQRGAVTLKTGRADGALEHAMPLHAESVAVALAGQTAKAVHAEAAECADVQVRN